MAGYTPMYRAAGSDPEHVGSRNRRQRTRRAPSPSRLNDNQLSAETQKPSSNPPKVRNRNSLAGQIRSLEKLLKHSGAKMSANTRQEKGRELAALVLERERKKAKLRATKNLGKYHMVRFVERQKCERILRQLRKKMEQVQDSPSRAAMKFKAHAVHEDSDSDMDADDGVTLPNVSELDLEEKIKQAEVDFNYTVYAPLKDKYISLFPLTDKEEISAMSGVSKSFLQPDKENEGRVPRNDNVVRNATGERPPMWYQVKQCMRDGTLEQLRDGKLAESPVPLPQIRGKSQAMQRMKAAPKWVDDDGTVAAEDVDSDGESDDDDQKIDGGFFERA